MANPTSGSAAPATWPRSPGWPGGSCPNWAFPRSTPWVDVRRWWVSAAPHHLEDTMATDVVELILADHRRFEELFRELRDRTSDRPALLGELAELLVAH